MTKVTNNYETFRLFDSLTKVQLNFQDTCTERVERSYVYTVEEEQQMLSQFKQVVVSKKDIMAQARIRTSQPKWDRRVLRIQSKKSLKAEKNKAKRKRISALKAAAVLKPLVKRQRPSKRKRAGITKRRLGESSHLGKGSKAGKNTVKSNPKAIK